ncbi:hypothetical protein PPSIR1_31183 [Plesiocystis pacifica SIR-1]|uniref:Uncharacterized protein n=1 Tax=Plesiocystis pacifica SIR-1 TaxID=391625 RepID=A6GHN8_9BACT|nr:hypothetical protein PPSIR1_31183 [Plesiocystis pacifica SIR-1]
MSSEHPSKPLLADDGLPLPVDSERIEALRVLSRELW